MSNRPTRSSSLGKRADAAQYPPLRDPNPPSSSRYESIPLSNYSNYSSPDLGSSQGRYEEPPPPIPIDFGHASQSPDRHNRNTSMTSSNTYAYNNSSDQYGGGDQPYSEYSERFGSIDLSEHKLAHSTSRTPIHPGATVTMTPDGSTEDLRKYKKSGTRTPRGHSAERSQGGGLGNWSGPAAGNSPYGPLGTGKGYSQGNGSGYNTPNMNASSTNPHLVFAEGDGILPPPTNAFSRFVNKVFDSSFLVRWLVYIVPILALLWIPGIVGLTVAPEARVWGVPLVWWSAWLSVVWGGWWGASLAAKMGPTLLRNTIGVVAPELRHYILYVSGVKFYLGAAAWALANWIAFSPLIRQRATNDHSKTTLQLITQGLFGIWIVLVILLGEKLVIQVIAHNFHKKSYEDRILKQKFQIKTLVSLYVNSRDIGRTDTLDGVVRPGLKKQSSDPALLVKSALRKAKLAAQSATTVIGAVASEIAGERVLQPNSPESVVTTSLGSANKTKQLARRIFFSFAPSYRHALLLEDISRCFKNKEEAEAAFTIFDRDANGDVSLEELEMSALEIHRERLALSNSMRDIDSAVQRLDAIFQGIWYIVSIVIIVGLLDASFNTFIASAGTLILGLSWLIGTTAQEVLASIIFLFIKHVYDVGDRVDIDGVSYVVKEMQLLSTIFRRVDGTIVQAPHSILNTKMVSNIRRSGAIQETFTWDIDFSTTFEKIEALRDRMLDFLDNERRDFFPQIDIAVKDFEGQGKLTLTAEIKYKSNWQNGALKAQRRNKWCCALKLAMNSLEIYGPDGAGDPDPAPADPTAVTLIPYEEVLKEDEAKAKAAKASADAEKATKAEVVHSGDAIKLGSSSAVLDDQAAESALDKPPITAPEGLSRRK